MSKLRQLSPELWPLIDVILFSYIELIFRGGVSCLPAALLLLFFSFLFSFILDGTPWKMDNPSYVKRMETSISCLLSPSYTFTVLAPVELRFTPIYQIVAHRHDS